MVYGREVEGGGGGGLWYGRGPVNIYHPIPVRIPGVVTRLPGTISIYHLTQYCTVNIQLSWGPDDEFTP